MTEKELLELAAKAAGISLTEAEWHGDGFYWMPLGTRFWNPLTDDGDALRLMVKLQMQIDVTNISVAVYFFDDVGRCGDIKVGCMDSDWGNDPLRAARRAIVLAAAELGKEVSNGS